MGLRSWWRVLRLSRNSYQDSYTFGMRGIYLHGHKEVDPGYSGEEMVFCVGDHAIKFATPEHFYTQGIWVQPEALGKRVFQVFLVEVAAVSTPDDYQLRVEWRSSLGYTKRGFEEHLLIRFLSKGQNHRFAQAILHAIHEDIVHTRRKLQLLDNDQPAA